MTITLTLENSQQIADIFNEWVGSLPEENRLLAAAHDTELRELNGRLFKKPGLGSQSRSVLLAVIYVWYLEHIIEGKRVPVNL